MDAIAYSAIYQMTYLFLETAQGKITNEKLNDSFQPFLFDLEEAITSQQEGPLDAIKTSVMEHFEHQIDNENDVQRFIQSIHSTLRTLDLTSDNKEKFFKETLEDLYKEMQEAI